MKPERLAVMPTFRASLVSGPGQIGYAGWQRHDFRGLDARAAVTVKAAAS
jgi:hypothetical protein